jgi:hypothetical protein
LPWAFRPPARSLEERHEDLRQGVDEEGSRELGSTGSEEDVDGEEDEDGEEVVDRLHARAAS